MLLGIYLEDLKASDVQDTHEGCPITLAPVKRLVDSTHDPLEEPLIHGLGQSYTSELRLDRGKGDRLTN